MGGLEVAPIPSVALQDIARQRVNEASARQTSNWLWSAAVGWANTSRHFFKTRLCSGALMPAKEAAMPSVPIPAPVPTPPTPAPEAGVDATTIGVIAITPSTTTAACSAERWLCLCDRSVILSSKDQVCLWTQSIALICWFSSRIRCDLKGASGSQ